MDENKRRRVKAAMSLAGMNALTVAREMDLTESTFNRRLRGIGLRARYQEQAFLAEVADVTGVGLDFLNEGDASNGHPGAARLGQEPPPIAQDPDEPKSGEEGPPPLDE